MNQDYWSEVRETLGMLFLLGLLIYSFFSGLGGDVDYNNINI